MEITVKRFPTGYYHISGEGVCDWSQPPRWPCDEATLRDYAKASGSSGTERQPGEDFDDSIPF